MPLRSTVHALLRRFGVDVVRYDADRFPELRRAQLLAERPVDLVLDVGANTGQYGESLRRAGYGGRIVSFEPVGEAFRELALTAARDDRWECRRLALGERAEAAIIHVAGNSTSSSLLPMAGRHVESAPKSAYVGDEQVDVRPLDELIGGLASPDERIWLKLDVQGVELDVLRGAERTLAQVDVVETELSLVELYEGQALFVDVIGHLTARGFSTRLLEPIFRDPTDGELLQLDGVFVRRR